MTSPVNALLEAAIAPRDHTAPLRLGFVPVGFLTVTEVTNMLENAILDKPTDGLPRRAGINKEELQALYRDVQRKVAKALVTGRLEAMVHHVATQQNFRIPATCWWPTIFDVEANDWQMGRLGRLLATDALAGQEFGIYQGMTPCILRADCEQFRDAGIEGSPSASDEKVSSRRVSTAGELNVPIRDRSVAKYTNDPEVIQVAATRIARAAGDPADEKLIRQTIWKMLKDQGHNCTFQAVKNPRNTAGFNAKKD